MNKAFVTFSFTWLVIGLIAMGLGFGHLLNSWCFLLLLLPISFSLHLGKKYLLHLASLAKSEKTLLAALIIIWLMALTGVLVPETGFDAVWYHLPIVAAFVKTGGYLYLPKYYQSVNPFFSDGIFLLGYAGFADVGTKIVAYLFALSLITASYFLARQVLSRFWSLLLILTISTFQVVAWQSASFYVDVAKAFWEVTAIYFLLSSWQNKSRQMLTSGLFFGATLATKLFSLLLWPIMIILLFVNGKKAGKQILIFSLVSLLVALPFYIFASRSIGNPFYALQLHTDNLGQIAGTNSLTLYLWQRTFLLPSSLTQLTLFSRDYTTLLFLVFGPLLFVFRKSLYQNKKILSLLIFSLGQWLIWWYVPPLSSRYALSGFITLAIVLFWCLQKYLQERPSASKYVLLTVGLALIINLLPRGFVFKRNAEYLLGAKTRQQYLEQFYDGLIDQNLKNWHHLP